MISEHALKKLRRFLEAREARDQAREALAKAEEEYRDLEAEVFDLMDENPIQGAIKLDLGEPFGVVSFQQRETVYGRIYDEDQAADYFEGRAMLDEVSKPKFVMSRINEEVRERLDNDEKLPPGVDYFARRYVSITRQKT